MRMHSLHASEMQNTKIQDGDALFATVIKTLSCRTLLVGYNFHNRWHDLKDHKQLDSLKKEIQKTKNAPTLIVIRPNHPLKARVVEGLLWHSCDDDDGDDSNVSNDDSNDF